MLDTNGIPSLSTWAILGTSLQILATTSDFVGRGVDSIW